ncbi:MAG: three-Cys-motif partner protein TcmP [Chloroflexota bacterium]|nr:three-Cys-motif partner protein TcmP [Chloroflexota bacterium]
MARARPLGARRQELLLVDGFAGPGRYLGGEDGSPIIMIKAFLEHLDREAIERTVLRYVFIESHRGRFEHLVDELEQLKPGLPPNVRIVPIQGEYGDVMETLLADSSERVPTFAFLDPFGYADTHLTLTSQILKFPRCEVLIYIPTHHIARFVGEADVAHGLDLLYGGREWESSIDMVFDERVPFLKELFRRALGRHADFVRSFEILTAAGGGYDLFFATKNELGLKKMKEAMWKIDPIHGRAFRFQPEGPQLHLFDAEADTVPLRHALQLRFGFKPFTVADAERFVAIDTDFIEDRHLKRATLAPLEIEGRLHVQRPVGARKGSWPGSTVLRFAW